MRSSEAVLDDLRVILSNFQDRDYSDEMTPETLFFSDLGFSSIDVIVLGDRLQEHYGQQISFNEFLGELGSQGAQDVSLGQLSDYLSRTLT